MIKNIEGVLRKDTIIYTLSTLQLRLPHGTKVRRVMNVVTFEGKDGVQVFKLNGKYMVSIYGEIHQVLFPKGGQVPYPMSLLRD